MKKSFGTTVLALTLLAGAAPVQAQFNLDGVISKAINTVANEAVNVVSNTSSDKPAATSAPASATKAGAKSVQSKPAGWPAKYKWYAYSEAPAVPAYKGKVQDGKMVKFVDGAETWDVDTLLFKTLPLQHAIVRVRGNGARKIAVFADPTCPYSRKQEQDMNKMDNVTIYTFVAPILGSKSQGIVDKIQCQPTNQARAQAYENYLLNKVEPAVVSPCPDVSRKILASLGNLASYDGSRYVDNSPFTVFENNIALMGLQSLSSIENAIAAPGLKR